MALPARARIGHREIAEPIGAGGMGKAIINEYCELMSFNHPMRAAEKSVTPVPRAIG